MSILFLYYIIMNEIWIEIINKSNRHDAIIAISNLGNMKRRNGVIEPIPLRQLIKREYSYRLLAEHFIPKTEEDIEYNRNLIDHISHNPIDMNVNDIRNLRWCNRIENATFDEALSNQRNSKLGSIPWNKGKKGTQIAWNKGISHSEETRKKISETLKGHTPWNKGLKMKK